MSERLERELRALADVAAWPQTPDIAAAVTARIAVAPGVAGAEGPAGAPGAPPPAAPVSPRRRAWRAPRRLWAPALVALLAAAAITPAGAAVLRWVGIGDTIRVTRVERLPFPATNPPITGLGERVTLGEARLLADFPLRVPAPPREVRFSDALVGGLVTLEYGDHRVSQFTGNATDYFQKLVGPGTEVRRTHVNGVPALFLTGGPTEILLGDRDGNPVFISGAAKGENVLLWQEGRIGFRLETAGDLAEALAIAQTFRRR